MPHDHVIINIEVAIRRDDGRYLMIVRGDAEEHAAGMLAFPGGGLDFDERQDVLETTAIREVLEEVGLHVTDLHYVESHSFVVGDDLVVDIVFLASYSGGEPLISDPGEVAAIEWLTAHEIVTHPKAPPWIAASIERVEGFVRGKG